MSVDSEGVASQEKEKIRILWTVNIMLPAVAANFDLAPTLSGGWLSGMLAQLAQLPDFRIGVAMLAPVKTLQHLESGGIEYFAVPHLAKDPLDIANEDAASVLNTFLPEILHAHGSEVPFTQHFMELFSGPRILSLQGVVNGIAPYQLGGLPVGSMLLNPFRPRQMLVALALLSNLHFKFRRRMRAEKRILLLANYLLGRTLWDRAHSYALNPKATYFHCGEVLRAEFYTKKWNIGNCQRKTIFIGNSYSPLKGAHVAIRALAKLHLHHPDARIFFAGQDTRKLPWYSLKRQFGYQAYLFSLISDLRLEQHVTFLDQLNAPQMIEIMNSSNVFLLPSLIENSPNTLGEAMMLGMPCVSASVGGVSSMAVDECEALLYRAEDVEMLAFQIQRLFEDDALSMKLSEGARLRALKTHDKRSNLDSLVAAYEAVSTLGAR